MRGAPFKKGNKANPKGRGAGTPNKATKEKREIISAILDERIDKLGQMIDDVLPNNPVAAFKMMNDLMEFVMPKMKAVEHTGEGGNVKIKFTFTNDRDRD